MRKIFLTMMIITGVMALIVSGCGGGGKRNPSPTPTSRPSATSTPTPTPTVTPTPTLPSVTLYGESALDGDTYKYFTDPVSYSFHADRAYINAGHEATGDPFHVSIRCLVSFDISSLPVGAVILSATLRIHKIGGNGDESAYAVLGNLLLDHVTYSTFSADLYNVAALETLATPFATSSAPNGTWKELGVATQVQNDLTAARTHSQFRLRFTKEKPDNGGDYASYYENWSSGESSEKPQLVITYSL